MSLRSAALLAAAAAVWLPSSALADPEPGPPARVRAEAACAEADRAVRELRFADAVVSYQLAIVADPSAPCSASARARGEDLEAHSEGGFGPLATLEAVRRDPRRMADRASIEALAAAVADFPPGRVRVEARMTLAHAWHHRLAEPTRAIAAYTDAIRDTTGDKLTRALALTELWALRRQRGEIAEALAEAERDPTLSPSTTVIIRHALRHHRLELGAHIFLGLLAAAALGAVAALARRARDLRELPGRVFRPFLVAFALYIGGAAALLVRARGDGDPGPFLRFGLALVALGAIARSLPLAAPLGSGLRRSLWAAVCVLGVLAAAFVAVDGVDESYLAGIGL